METLRRLGLACAATDGLHAKLSSYRPSVVGPALKRPKLQKALEVTFLVLNSFTLNTPHQVTHTCHASKTHQVLCRVLVPPRDSQSESVEMRCQVLRQVSLIHISTALLRRSAGGYKWRPIHAQEIISAVKKEEETLDHKSGSRRGLTLDLDGAPVHPPFTLRSIGVYAPTKLAAILIRPSVTGTLCGCRDDGLGAGRNLQGSLGAAILEQQGMPVPSCLPCGVSCFKVSVWAHIPDGDSGRAARTSLQCKQHC